MKVEEESGKDTRSRESNSNSFSNKRGNNRRRRRGTIKEKEELFRNRDKGRQPESLIKLKTRGDLLNTGVGEERVSSEISSIIIMEEGGEEKRR